MILSGKETREKRQHATALVPYSLYRCRIPTDFRSVPLHWHSELEINRIRQGRGEFLCGGDRWEMEEAELLTLPPNLLHAAYSAPNAGLIYDALVFSPSMLGANDRDRCAIECVRPLINGTMTAAVRIDRRNPRYPALRDCADRIFSCVEENSAYGDLLLKSELLRLVWILEGDPAFLRRERPGIRDWESLRPALEYMMENFSERITVELLAQVSHQSASHFMSCFKKAAGVSAMEYLAQLRINAACEALASTKEKISEIALRCGYGNLSNFNRQFRRIAGCSPKEYRSHSAGGK